MLLEQIKAEATPGTQQHAIDLIMPSTLHTAQKCHKDLPHGAEMLLYCGIVDLDAEPNQIKGDYADVNKAKRALKDKIQDTIKTGATLSELRAVCPDFHAVVEAALGAQTPARRAGPLGFLQA